MYLQYYPMLTYCTASVRLQPLTPPNCVSLLPSPVSPGEKVSPDFTVGLFSRALDYALYAPPPSHCAKSSGHPFFS